MINDLSNYNINIGKDGRVRAYDKITHKGVSYPRLIMENFLNRRLLKTEDVHHKDGNPLNNEIDNLEVIDHKEHDKLHGGKNKKYNNKIMNCPVCNKEFIWTPIQQSSFYSHGGNTKKGPFCSRRCAGIYSTSIQYKNKRILEYNKICICPICGKEFTQSKASQSRYDNKKNKFDEPVCSSACRFKYKRNLKQ